MSELAVQPFLTEWLEDFTDPRKRVYWGYLLSAIVIALAWLALARGVSLRESLATVFSRRCLWSRSARADYLLMLLNSVVMLAISPRLLASTTVAYLLFQGLHDVLGGRPVVAADVPAWAIPIAFTACLFIVDDFARYWVHRWLHTVRALWVFHKVHHSAEVLNPFTIFRTHPVEGVLFSLRSAVVQGGCVALFFFLFGDRVTLVTVMGASVFTFAFNALGSNLRHSNVSIGYWRPVERILMSPAQHHVHHSHAPEHRDRNFGVALALWDWLFATHCHSEPERALRYGLTPHDGPAVHSLRTLYLGPFLEIWPPVRARLPFVRARRSAQTV